MLNKSVAIEQVDLVRPQAVDAEVSNEALVAPQPVASPPTGVRYGVLCGLCLIATIAYIQRSSIGIAESSIRAELNLSETQMGQIMSAFFIAYAVFQIPSGAMVQAWGVRRALSTMSIVFSLTCGLFAGCFSWGSFVAARALMGITQAGVFPASTTAISKWFPATERAFPNGGLSGFMQIGGAVGAMLAGWLLATIGWRWMFVCYAIPGLIWAAWFYWWYRNTPAENPSANGGKYNGSGADREPACVPNDDKLPTPWAALLTNRSMAAICGQQFCRACAATFFATWFATYLKETRDVTLVKAGLLTSLPLWSMMLGAFTGGFASDCVFRRTGDLNAARRGIAVWCMLGCAALASLTYFVADPVLATLRISSGSFCAAMAGPCSYSITIDVGGRHVPAVFSTMNMCGNIGSATFPLLVPFFLGLTNDNWDLVQFLFVGLYIIAAGFWLLTDASRPIFSESYHT